MKKELLSQAVLRSRTIYYLSFLFLAMPIITMMPIITHNSILAQGQHQKAVDDSSANISTSLNAPEISDIDRSAIRKSVIKVHLTPISFKYRQPWKREVGNSVVVMGLVIANNRILIPMPEADSIGLIEVLKYSSYERVLARPISIDPEARLMLLTVDDDDFFTDLKPLSLSLSDLFPASFVELARIDDLFNVYTEKSKIHKLSLWGSTPFVFLPTVQIIPKSKFPLGTLVLCGDKICAFVVDIKRDKLLSFPASVVRSIDQFPIKNSSQSDDSEIQQTTIFPSQGFKWADMIDPVQKEYYKVPVDSPGVLITRVMPYSSAWKVLRKNDILLEIDGVVVDNRGYYEDPIWGRQNLHHMIVHKKGVLRKSGDKLMMLVIRSGQKKKLSMKLKAYTGASERIPRYSSKYGKQPDYLIENGLVFLELSLPYVKEVYGLDWSRVDTKIAYYMAKYRYLKKPAAGERIVWISEILPNETNTGLKEIIRSRVLKADGKQVKNLKHFYKILNKAQKKKKTVMLELAHDKRCYLDLELRDALNKQILSRYKIPSEVSF